VALGRLTSHLTKTNIVVNLKLPSNTAIDIDRLTPNIMSCGYMRVQFRDSHWRIQILPENLRFQVGKTLLTCSKWSMTGSQMKLGSG
jgi:hypothetical protein